MLRSLFLVALLVGGGLTPGAANLFAADEIIKGDDGTPFNFISEFHKGRMAMWLTRSASSKPTPPARGIV